VSITGNQFFGGAATGINFNNIASNGVHIAGNNLSVGKPIANLGNINGHAFLGNNVGGTPLPNSVSNDLTVKTDLTVGGSVVGNNDNVSLGLSYGGVGLGFVKKAGTAPFIGFGRGHNFSIAQSGTSDVSVRQTFTPLLIVNETGTAIKGVSALREMARAILRLAASPAREADHTSRSAPGRQRIRADMSSMIRRCKECNWAYMAARSISRWMVMVMLLCGKVVFRQPDGGNGRGAH
jgi:hypothetical protein